MSAAKEKKQLVDEIVALRKKVLDLENRHRRADELILQSIHNWEDTFDNITDMITIHDRNFNIIYANKAADKILGLPYLDAAHAKCFKYYHGKDAPPEGCPSCDCLNTAEPVSFEVFEPHLNRFVEIRAMPQFDSNRKLIGLIHIVRDITERKEMEEALQHAHDKLEQRVRERTAELVKANEEMANEINERRKVEGALRESESKFKKLSREFNVLLDAIPDNIVLLSTDLEILWANRSAALDFGSDISSLHGQFCYKVCRNFSSHHENCPTIKSFITGQEENSQMSTPDGRFLDVRVFPILDDGGMVKSVIEVARDITTKIRMEKEARLIQAKLIHANKMTSLGTLVSGVAHEINNPNTFIKSNAQVLLRIWKDVSRILEKYHRQHGDFLLAGLPYSEVHRLAPEVIKGIDQGSIRIQDIVDNLRDFARPEKARLNGTVHVNDVVTAATSILSNHINKHTLKFQFLRGNDIPPVRGNAQQIEQVVINLIMNALQALESKECGVRVSTSYDRHASSVVIRIKDNGIGMMPQVLERVTEPFFTTKLDSGGTGLGLSISYAIIKEHSGQLEFSSRVGRGTTVTIRLPAAKSAVVTARPARDSSTRAVH